LPRGRAMKLHYYPETDSLYIELKSGPGAESREIVEGLVVDLDARGEVVGFDIDHASRKLDLSKIETIALPPATAAEVRGNTTWKQRASTLQPQPRCHTRASRDPVFQRPRFKARWVPIACRL